MNLAKKCLLGLSALALAGSAAAGTLFSEGFNDLSTSGWVLTNKSTPLGLGLNWFQGGPEIFTAHSGPDNSYAAANFNSADIGGALSNWLISPEFTVGNGATLNFSARGALADGYFDTINVYFSAGSGTSTESFDLLGTLEAPTDGWMDFSYLLPVAASGRIAFEYAGLADNANYAGIDSVSVVPEPASFALVGLALAGLGLSRRKAAHKN